MADLATPRALIVLGMHRSGTSLAAALLQQGGVDIGRRLLGPSRSNVRGHFENLEFLEFHVGLLRARGLNDAGYTTQSQFAFTDAEAAAARRLVAVHETAPAWGWKDPRTTLFAESWDTILNRACYLCVFRAPWEVLDSLFRRDSAYDAVFAEQPGLAIEAWSAYNTALLALRDRAADRCLLASAESLVADPRLVVAQVNARFGLALAEPPADIADASLLRTVDNPRARAAEVVAYSSDVIALFTRLLETADLANGPTDREWLKPRRVRRDPSLALRDWHDTRAQATALSSLRAELGDLRRASAEIEADRAQLLQRIPALERATQQVASEADRLRQHLDETIRNATTERERLSARVDAAQNEAERLRAHLDQTIRNAGAERERLVAQATQGEQDLDRLRTHLDEAMRNAAAERERATTQLADVERRAAADHAGLARAQAEVDRVQGFLDEALRNAEAERERAATQLAEVERRAGAQLLAALEARATTEALAAQTRADADRLAELRAEAERDSEDARAHARQLASALLQVQSEADAAAHQAARALQLARDAHARLRDAQEHAKSLEVEISTARAEADRVSYYLGETMRNAVEERERLQRALSAAHAARLAIEVEGVKVTARRLRRKAHEKARWLAEHHAPGATRAWRTARQRLYELRHRASSPRRAPSAPGDIEALRDALAIAASRPAEPVRVSIVTPLWNTAPALAIETARSVLQQTRGAWEWCIVDDGSNDGRAAALLARVGEHCPRVRVRLAPHGGISAATNAAIEMATGEYVAFLDHDDLLAPTAIEGVIAALSAGVDAVYTDEDKTDAHGQRFYETFHKPDWSPEYLRGVMYVGHLLVVKRTVVTRVGGLDSRFDGVQDFELALRLGEAGARIGHVPKVLYHWRQIPGSVASDPGAKSGIERLQQAAVDAHLARIGLPATAAPGPGPHRVRLVPGPRDAHARVSIVIPSKDAPELLGHCLESIYSRTTYPSFEVLVIDNDTRDRDALALMHRYPVRRIPFPGAFNYSKANNAGAAEARGDFVVFLNNDTEVLTADWLEHMTYYAGQEDVGAVGALLLFPDRTVQHAGIVLGFRGTADHVMRGFPAEVDGYAGSLACAREVSAVTGACMMISARRFAQAGRFNEHFATHYQDVDLCMRLQRLGLRNIFTPRAMLLHFESATRGPEYDMLDRMLLLDGWEAEIAAGDRYYNPNFDLSRHDYGARQPA